MRLSQQHLKHLESRGYRVAAATPCGRGGRIAVRRASNAAMPQDVLWRAVAVRHASAVQEYPGAVPGRRFRIDIALPVERVAIEVDGWQHHGKFLEAHTKDRERQNLLAVNDWLVLRFTAAQIYGDIEAVMSMIDRAAAMRNRKATS